MLKWLKQEGYAFDQSTCEGAAERGQLAALQHLRNEGCEWDAEDIACRAAASGSIDTLEWLRQQQGVEIDSRVMTAAAGAGQTAMCEYLHSIGCAWDTNACTEAADNGHLSTLRWLREAGCPWDVRQVCRCASYYGSTDILDYMIEQGAVLSTALVSRGLDNAGASNDLQAAQWFRQHGAQRPAVLGRFAYPHCDQWSPEL
jgi:hypothetical protein